MAGLENRSRLRVSDADAARLVPRVRSCDNVFVGNWESHVKRASFLVFLVSASLAGALTVSAVGLAQTPATSSQTAPVTGMKPDRTTAPTGLREKMQSKEAVLRKKRAECRAKAKAEKVPLVKRPAYVKKCRSETK